MAALLTGLFVAPALLLWLGHRLRRRSALARRVFWGGVTGHTLGMLVTLVAAHYPPVFWGGEGWRAVAVHASMLAGASLGAAAGAVQGWRYREPVRSTLEERLRRSGPLR